MLRAAIKQLAFWDLRPSGALERRERSPFHLVVSHFRSVEHLFRAWVEGNELLRESFYRHPMR
jgi:hypothetical protein